MKNIKFSRLFAAMMFVAVLSFAGCKQPESEKTYPIYGKWVDAYESYNTYDTYDCSIENNKVETASYGAHKGSVYIVETSENSGYVYYQFETNVIGYGSAPDSTPFEVESKGKWEIKFKNKYK